MFDEELLDTTQVKTGQYRWVYRTVGGAEWAGRGLYKSKATAKAAGKREVTAWLAEHPR